MRIAWYRCRPRGQIEHSDTRRSARGQAAIEGSGASGRHVLRRVDRLVTEAALVGREDVAASPRERGRLAPAARADRAIAPEGRVVANGCGHEAHFREAHGTGEGQAGVTQRFAGALLEQSADGHAEFRGETLGRSAVRRQVGRSTGGAFGGALHRRRCGRRSLISASTARASVAATAMRLWTSRRHDIEPIEPTADHAAAKVGSAILGSAGTRAQ
jgi:hypothetical protein